MIHTQTNIYIIHVYSYMYMYAYACMCILKYTCIHIYNLHILST